MLVCKYIFDNSIYNNLIPTFNSGYKGYTVTDEIDGSYTTRTIECDTLPTEMIFGTGGAADDKSKSLLEVLQMDISECTRIKFDHTINITRINTEDWDTSNITNMSSMFYNCRSLTELNLSDWDTSKVTNMSGMFYNCNNLSYLNVDNWDIGKVSTMGSMFYNCNNLTALDVSNWNTSNVTDMSNMFYGCTNLSSIMGIEDLDVSSVTTLVGTFWECKALTYLDLSKWVTTSLTNLQWTFVRCTALFYLDVSNWDTSNVNNMCATFSSCIELTEIVGINNWDVSNVTTQFDGSATGLFQGCAKLTSLDLSKWEFANLTNMAYMFSGCTNLEELNVSNFNTSNVTSMNDMFYNCSSLTELDLNGWNINKVNSLQDLFRGCTNLTHLDVNKWDTSNVTNMQSLFQDCTNLTQLDVSKWNTSKVTQSSAIFRGCQNLTELDVSNWDTSKMTGFYATFLNCKNLTRLDLGKWNTSQATTMFDLFYGMDKLVALDISNFDLSKIPNPTIFGYTSFPTYVKFNNVEQMDKLVNYLPTRVSKTQGVILCKQEDLSLIDINALSSKNWIVTNEFTKVAEYVYDRSIYNNFIPEFNSNYGLGYFCEDVIEDETKSNEVRRTIESVQGLPTLMRFGDVNVSVATDAKDKQLSLKKINYADVTNCTSLQSFCKVCANITEATIIGFSSKITDMAHMFYHCSNLRRIDASNWNTSNVTTMNGLFDGCSRLILVIGMDKWNTSNVRYMNSVFAFCNQLITVTDASNWNTDNVITMSSVFRNCFKLTQLDLSNWNTSNATNMDNIFANCINLKYLDISNFNTSSLTSTNRLTNCSCDIGMLYCSQDTINKLAPLLKGNDASTIYVKDIRPSELNVVEGITFKEYRETNNVIQLNSPLLEGDEIIENDGKLCHYHKMGKVVLDGSEDWESISEGGLSNTKTSIIQILPNWVENMDNININIFSNKLAGYSADYIWKNDVEGICYNAGGFIQIRFNKNKIIDLTINDFKQWLSENPIIAIYKLNKPYYEDITPIQSQWTIKTLEEGNMEILTNLPVRVNMTYLTNIPSLSTLSNRVKETKESDNLIANLTNMLGDEINQ